jgi:predicted Zn-dependent protease
MLLAAALACAGGGEQTLDDVRALQDSGAYGDTLAPLRALLEREPNHPEANYRLGLALVNTGRSSAAVFPLKRAATDDAMARQAGLLLASTFMQMRNFEEAMLAADGVLQRDPDSEAALLVRTQAAIGANDAAAALTAAERLVALQPDDPGYKSLQAGSLMSLGKVDEAEKILLAIEGVPWANDPSGVGKTCLVLANFYGRFRTDPERAAAKVAECLARYPDDLALPPIAADSYDQIGRPELATALMRAALEKTPDDLGLRQVLAKRMLTQGDRAGGERMMEEAARTSGNPKAWLHLAGVRRTAGDPEGALRALDEALALAPDSEEFRFARADVLMDLARYDEIEPIAAKLQEATFARILRGRLALERGNPQEALALLGPAIEQWPTNAGARVLAARAAYELGDETRAFSELREATRSEPDATDAALLLARFYYARGNYDQAIEFALRHSQKRGTGMPAAHQIGIWSHTAKGSYEDAHRFLDDLRAKDKAGAFAGVALAEEARLVAREKDADAARQLLLAQRAQLGEPAYEPALRTLIELERAAGRTRQASALVDELAAKHPDVAALQALRGDLQLAANNPTGAAASYESALRLDPRSAAALAGQGRLARAQGRTADAVALFDRAAAEAPATAQYGYEAAQALLASGDTAAARSRLDALVRRHPEHGGAANDLAWLLAAQGQELDRAALLAETASRLVPGPEVLDTLGFVRLTRGEHDAAADAFQKALALQPDYATARYHLGLARAQQGDRNAAREAFQQALEHQPFPEADQARTALAQLDAGAGDTQK